MKVWIKKRDLKYLKEMQSEARTRVATISTFRQFEDDSEVELDLGTDFIN